MDMRDAKAPLKRDRQGRSDHFRQTGLPKWLLAIAVIELFDENECFTAECVWEGVGVKAKSWICNVVPARAGQRMAFPYTAIVSESPPDAPMRREQAQLVRAPERRRCDETCGIGNSAGWRGARAWSMMSDWAKCSLWSRQYFDQQSADLRRNTFKAFTDAVNLVKGKHSPRNDLAARASQDLKNRDPPFKKGAEQGVLALSNPILIVALQPDLYNAAGPWKDVANRG